MKILHINTNKGGGAAKACTRLNESLNKNEIYSNILLLNNSPDNNFLEYRKTTLQNFLFLIYKIRNKIFKSIFLIKKENILSFPDSQLKIESSKEYKNSDVINLHWVSSFLDYKFFSKNGKLLVWTLHDMEPFSGGTHYSNNKINLLNKIILKYKKYYLFKGRKQINIVCPSKWLMNISKNSELFSGFPHYHIPNPFNQNIFKKYDKENVRGEFKISKEKKVILFVSDSINEKRKGFSILLEAFNKIKDDNIILCSVGNNKNKIDHKNYIDLGYIKDEETMSKIYSMADVFVIPSLEDNLPNTMIESIMCGTPVVGFEIGGIKETIKNGFNGFLSKEIDSDSLLTVINKTLDSNFNNEKIIENSISKYSYDAIAKQYIELYNKIK
jgi:glycosyltransferase involved in cell wall biosynthesis